MGWRAVGRDHLRLGLGWSVLGGGSAKMAGMTTNSEVIQLRFDPRDQAADRYPAVPFEVAGARAVQVVLSYEPEQAVLDLLT